MGDTHRLWVNHLCFFYMSMSTPCNDLQSVSQSTTHCHVKFSNTRFLLFLLSRRDNGSALRVRPQSKHSSSGARSSFRTGGFGHFELAENTRIKLSKRGIFALFFATSKLRTHCGPAQTAGTARESTQSAALLQETHTQDVTRNFGRPSSCDTVRMTFGFRPETNACSILSAMLEHWEELFLMRTSFHHHHNTGSLAVQNERNFKRVLEAI